MHRAMVTSCKANFRVLDGHFQKLIKGSVLDNDT